MTRERKVFAGRAASFDERRNSSSVKPVPPDALPNALRALERSRDEEWYQWILKRWRGEHDHGSVQKDGKRSACPVAGCTEPLDP